MKIVGAILCMFGVSVVLMSISPVEPWSFEFWGRNIGLGLVAGGIAILTSRQSES